ncbi:MAG: hypothetical protein QF918_12815, partial [Pirellulaceae bacterium]|nr:hypothetical protein [Pirellulaceae bacterium]
CFISYEYLTDDQADLTFYREWGNYSPMPAWLKSFTGDAWFYGLDAVVVESFPLTDDVLDDLRFLAPSYLILAQPDCSEEEFRRIRQALPKSEVVDVYYS